MQSLEPEKKEAWAGRLPRAPKAKQTCVAGSAFGLGKGLEDRTANGRGFTRTTSQGEFLCLGVGLAGIQTVLTTMCLDF